MRGKKKVTQAVRGRKGENRSFLRLERRLVLTWDSIRVGTAIEDRNGPAFF